MISNSEDFASKGDSFGEFRVMKLLVSALCLGEANHALSGGKGEMMQSLAGCVLVMVGIGLLFGVYRGCRWCRLLSWMSWLGLPLVAGYFLWSAFESWTSNPENPFKQCILLNHAVRYVGPVVLGVWMWRLGRNMEVSLPDKWVWVLRFAAAATFAGHGFNALRGSPAHVELIQFTYINLLGREISLELAKQVLAYIGTMDVVLALLLVLRRWRWVAMWMAVWGLVTAGSRLSAYGIGEGWNLTAIRLGNGGIPLVIWWLWHRNSVFPDGETIAGKD